MQSVWTATVWGGANGRASLAADLAGTLAEGEDECHICKGDVPASVICKPCDHKLCIACVEQLRAKNIFKADKGVHCPFCRGAIREYAALNSDPALEAFLVEANRAAGVAQQARLQAQRVAAAREAAEAAATSAAEPQGDWTCRLCANVNFASRDACNRCGAADPRPKPKPKDLLKVSDRELIAFACEKLHPHLNRAFHAAGTPFTNNEVGGDEQSIMTAFQQRGEERLCRWVHVLTGSGEVLMEVAQHFYGGFTVQDTVIAAAKVRAALAARDQSYMLDGFRAQHGGHDLLGAIVTQALPHAAELAMHEKSTWVMQRLLEYGSPQEVMDISAAVFAHAVELTADTKSVHVVQACMHGLRDTCGEVHREEALALVQQFCKQMLGRPDRLLHCARSPLQAKVAVDAVAVGLPGYSALQLGAHLASLAEGLATFSYEGKHTGLGCLLALMNTRCVDLMADDLARDIACLAASYLQGRYVGLLLLEDAKGARVVQACLDRLAAEQELEWLGAVLQELVAAADALAAKGPAKLEVLIAGLSHILVDEDSVEAHLCDLAMVLSAKQAAQLAAEVRERRDAQRGFRLPPPRYCEPSFVQPGLRHLICAGLWHPPPPPAPPPMSRAGSLAAPAQPQLPAQPQQQQQQQQQQAPAQPSHLPSYTPLPAFAMPAAIQAAKAIARAPAPAITPAAAAPVTQHVYSSGVVHRGAHTLAALESSVMQPPTAMYQAPAAAPAQIVDQLQHMFQNATRLAGPQRAAAAASNAFSYSFTQPASSPPGVLAPPPQDLAHDSRLASLEAIEQQMYMQARASAGGQAMGGQGTWYAAPPAAAAAAAVTPLPPPPPVTSASFGLPYAVPTTADAARASAQHSHTVTRQPPVPAKPDRQPAYQPPSQPALQLLGPGSAMPYAAQSALAPQRQQAPVAAARPAAAAYAPTAAVALQPAPVPAARPGGWQCSFCTYEHTGPEANYLACAMCTREKGP